MRKDRGINPNTSFGRAGKPEGEMAGKIQEEVAKTTESITKKTRADYEEDYKRAHIDLITEFMRDASGL